MLLGTDQLNTTFLWNLFPGNHIRNKKTWQYGNRFFSLILPICQHFFWQTVEFIAKQKQNWHNLSNNLPPLPPLSSWDIKRSSSGRWWTATVSSKGWPDSNQSEDWLTPIDRSHWPRNVCKQGNQSTSHSTDNLTAGRVHCTVTEKLTGRFLLSGSAGRRLYCLVIWQAGKTKTIKTIL